jgi:hypothetical protein
MIVTAARDMLVRMIAGFALGILVACVSMSVVVLMVMGTAAGLAVRMVFQYVRCFIADIPDRVPRTAGAKRCDAVHDYLRLMTRIFLTFYP